MTPKTSAGSPRQVLRWEEHKERTRRDLLASARKPEALTASPESFPMRWQRPLLSIVSDGLARHEG